MKPEDSRHGFADDAYIARPGWRANLPILVACVAVDVFLLYRTVRYPEPGLAVVLAVFGVVTALVAFFITRSIRRGDVSFAVDSGGVYFGPTDRETQSVLIPWSWIECIVTFDLIAYEGKQRVRRRCVGVELNAMGVTERMRSMPRPPDAPPMTAAEKELLESVLGPWLPPQLAEPSLVSRQVKRWRLDTKSLAQAVERYAPDKPIEPRPTRRDPGIAQFAANAWQVYQNLRRFRGR